MKWILFSLIVLQAGCAATSPQPTDMFARQAEFAADRERETLVVEQLDLSDACAHVVAVLMDMDCKLVEINSALGVISATPSHAYLGMPAHLPLNRELAMAIPVRSCSGHGVTVSVVERSRGDIAIRSSFTPTAAAADEMFRKLLRSSIAQRSAEGEGR